MEKAQSQDPRFTVSAVGNTNDVDAGRLIQGTTPMINDHCGYDAQHDTRPDFVKADDAAWTVRRVSDLGY